MIVNPYEYICSLLEKYEHVYERPKYFNAEGYVSKTSRPEYESLLIVQKQIPKRDNCIISISDNMEQTIKFTDENWPTLDEYEKFFEDFEDDEIADFKIEIEKNISDSGIISIYNYNLFSKYIVDESLVASLKTFTFFLKGRNYIEFEVLDREILFDTDTMYFHSPGRIVKKDRVDRAQILKKSIDVVYFMNCAELQLIPNDFAITSDFEGNIFSSIFNRNKTLLSIAFLSTITSFDDQYLKGQINGQRSIEVNISIDSITNNDTLFKICSWIYCEGNHVDKALIARNIISLHCKFTKLCDLDDKTYSSIQANYSLYLKENVKDYIELKNKLSELMCHLSAEVSDQVGSLLTGVKTNIVAVLGFVISVVLVNITSSSPLDNIFTKDIKIIFELVLAGSLVYWLVALLEAKLKSSRIFSSYEQLKKSYDDILTDKDIDYIFDGDKLINKARENLKHGFWLYSIIWVLLILGAMVYIIAFA